MRVAIEQASGEKYRSMAISLAFDPLSRAGVDFYTVPHNINRVKEFFAKWYKKERSQRPRLDPNRSAAAARAATSRRWRWQKRSICSARMDSPRPRSTI